MLTFRRSNLIVFLILGVYLLLIEVVFIVNDKWCLRLGVLALVELMVGWPWHRLPRNRALLQMLLLETCPQMLPVLPILVLGVHLDHGLKIESPFIAKARVFGILTGSLDLLNKLCLWGGLIQALSKISLPCLKMFNLLYLLHKLFTRFIHNVIFCNTTKIFNITAAYTFLTSKPQFWIRFIGEINGWGY